MTDRVLDQSREAIRVGSKSFAAAAKIFDPQCREDAYLLYAWCRHCDDRIDGQELGHGTEQSLDEPARERLDKIRSVTERALDNEPTGEPAFDALRRVVERNQIPAAYPRQLIDGFEMDVGERHYETLEDTLSYCYHVAGVVGVMMAQVMGVRDPATLDRASDLGIAFQLTNIARDVMDDARSGRVYLPQQWLEERGVAPEGILAPEHRDAVFEVVRRLLAEADRYYASSRWGAAALPFRRAWAICAAHKIYSDIGRLVLGGGPRGMDRRAVVSKPRKLFLVAKAFFSALWARTAMRLRDAAPRRALWTRPHVPA